MEGDKLISRVHELPPELFDMIYDNVFTVEASRNLMTETHKPPKFLSIDHRSREKYAESYYGGHTFEFILDKTEVSQWHESRLIKWLAALPQHHLEMLRDVRVCVRYPDVDISPEMFKELKCGWDVNFRVYRMFLMMILEALNLGQIQRILAVEGRVKIGNGVEWALFGCDNGTVPGPCSCCPLIQDEETIEEINMLHT